MDECAKVVDGCGAVLKDGKGDEGFWSKVVLVGNKREETEYAED